MTFLLSCLHLFWEFLKVGLFTFGGGYGAIPIIRDAILQNPSWGVDEELFYYIVGVAESTPGPIMVNTATYIGTATLGPVGALAATLGAVTPSFIIILLIASLLKGFMEKEGTRTVLDTVKPCVVGIILSTGVYFILSGLFPQIKGIVAGEGISAFATDWQTILIFALLFGLREGYKLWKKKPISPILSIAVAAVLGIVIWGV